MRYTICDLLSFAHTSRPWEPFRFAFLVCRCQLGIANVMTKCYDRFVQAGTSHRILFLLQTESWHAELADVVTDNSLMETCRNSYCLKGLILRNIGLTSRLWSIVLRRYSAGTQNNTCHRPMRIRYPTASVWRKGCCSSLQFSFLTTMTMKRYIEETYISRTSGSQCSGEGKSRMKRQTDDLVRGIRVKWKLELLKSLFSLPKNKVASGILRNVIWTADMRLGITLFI